MSLQDKIRQLSVHTSHSLIVLSLRHAAGKKQEISFSQIPTFQSLADESRKEFVDKTVWVGDQAHIYSVSPTHTCLNLEKGERPFYV